MAWKKIPVENHPVFLDALPDDPRIETKKMFGGVCGLVGGHMFAGLWANSVVVRLAEDERNAAREREGAVDFDPLGHGRPMAEMVLLPATVMKRKAALRRYLKKAADYTGSLPPKPNRNPTRKAAPKKPTRKK